MCVTNTTYRRSQPISLAPPSNNTQTSSTFRSDPSCSGLTQRLIGTFQIPTAPAKPQFLAQPTASAPLAAAAAAPSYSEHVAQAVPSLPASSLSTGGGKPRPKRRRKPQKPGKTAKMNDRHFVVHNYHDHAEDHEDDSVDTEEEHHHDDGSCSRRKGGVAVAFPLKLHAILDQVERDGLASVISWQPHGRCFVIHQPKVFVETVMPKYFRQTKLTSFQRQLNLYGFCRLTRGADSGGYYHELFLRGKEFLTKKMIRTKVKGTKFKAASSPDQEPDFYSMPPVVVTPAASPHTTPQVAPQQEIPETMLSPQQLAAAAPVALPPQLSEALAMFQNQTVPIQAVQNFSFFNPAAQPPPPLFAAPAAAPSADQVLDEAVDELFMDGTAEAMGDLSDFVQDWDPNQAIAQSLENDAQLGYMLDRLLED